MTTWRLIRFWRVLILHWHTFPNCHIVGFVTPLGMVNLRIRRDHAP